MAHYLRMWDDWDYWEGDEYEEPQIDGRRRRRIVKGNKNKCFHFML